MKETKTLRFTNSSRTNLIADYPISLLLFTTFSFIDTFVLSKTFSEKLLIQFSNIRV